MPPRPLGPAPPPGSGAPPLERLPTTEQHCLQGHEGPVLAVRFNSQGTYCLSCGKVGRHRRRRRRWHHTCCRRYALAAARPAAGPCPSTAARPFLPLPLPLPGPHGAAVEPTQGHPHQGLHRARLRRARRRGSDRQQQVSVATAARLTCRWCCKASCRPHRALAAPPQVCVMWRRPPGLSVGRDHRPDHPQVPGP